MPEPSPPEPDVAPLLNVPVHQRLDPFRSFVRIGGPAHNFHQLVSQQVVADPVGAADQAVGGRQRHFGAEHRQGGFGADGLGNAQPDEAARTPAVLLVPVGTDDINRAVPDGNDVQPAVQVQGRGCRSQQKPPAAHLVKVGVLFLQYGHYVLRAGNGRPVERIGYGAAGLVAAVPGYAVQHGVQKVAVAQVADEIAVLAVGAVVVQGSQ